TSSNSKVGTAQDMLQPTAKRPSSIGCGTQAQPQAPSAIIPGLRTSLCGQRRSYLPRNTHLSTSCNMGTTTM
ncbi:unnamed protein product, partial [Amoebophrya sp. A25]